jgi:hypothetical protein
MFHDKRHLFRRETSFASAVPGWDKGARLFAATLLTEQAMCRTGRAGAAIAG